MAKSRKLTYATKFAYVMSYHRVRKRLINSGSPVPSMHRMSRYVGIDPSVLGHILEEFGIEHKGQVNCQESCVEVSV